MASKPWLWVLAPLLLTACNPSSHNPKGPQKAGLQADWQAHTFSAGMVAGHQATVNCLRSERGQTDGSELRCESWDYVQANYPKAQP
jgi:hypothetical protein